MEIRFKSEKGNFDAKANYTDKSIIILKDSIISNKKYNCKISPKIEELRKDKNIVKDYIVIKDVSFDSLSSAAQFVSGYKANGLRVWKTKDGKK